MRVEHLSSLDDPRLDPYRNLKDRELAREGDRFIAEGEFVVRRLIAAGLTVDSVLLSERRVEDISPLVPENVPVFAVPDAVMQGVVGFKFHSGVLACGARPPSPSVDHVMEKTGPRCTLVVCPEIINAENVGSLIRISAAFGAAAMILGERSCDPYWRRSIRVSMGTIFSLPVVRSADLLTDLHRLRERWGVELVATVTDADAQPLETQTHPGRLALLLGSESQGLHRRWRPVCQLSVTIPMQLGTDSLNVSIAAAVFLYHYTRVARDG